MWRGVYENTFSTYRPLARSSASYNLTSTISNHPDNSSQVFRPFIEASTLESLPKIVATLKTIGLPPHSVLQSAHTKDGITFVANAGHIANTIAGELAAVDLRGLIGVAILRFV
jgi:hypothetical protein